MRRLLFLPCPFILLACGDGSPVDPAVPGDLDPLMATLEAPMMVPFVAHGTWWRAFPGENPEICDEFPVSSYGPISMEANGTHMGLTFWTVDQCWGPPQNPDGSYLRLSVARAVAANGDAIFMRGSPVQDGTQFISYPDGTFELFPYTVTGGTGRFENATGWFHTYGGGALTGSGPIRLVGQISSVGSSM